MSKLRKTKFTTAIRKAEKSSNKADMSSRGAAVSSLHILFWQRKSGNKPGFVTINCRLTYQGKRKDASTGIQCQVGAFDPIRQTTPKDPDTARLLSELYNRLQATYADLRITGRPVSSELIWNAANGVLPQEPEYSLINCIELFFAQREEEHKLKEITTSYFKKLRTWNDRLTTFAKTTYGKEPELEDVKPADAKRLLLWLKKEYNYTNNVAVMIVAHFKRVLNFALENEWITRNPLMNYRRKLDKYKTDRLTEAEVDTLRTAEIFAPAVEHIRRAFVFQCYTGLSYAELCRVNVNNILVDQRTGAEYIKISRTKTGVEANIPLVQEARKIIDSFADHPARARYGLLIPMISNQKYNVALKQLAGLVGIQKRITSHVARRTAATIYLKKGAPLESVASMLGHASTQVTQRHYTVMDSERVVRDFNSITELSKVS